MNHKEFNHETFTNVDDNEILVKQGGSKIEQQRNR